MQNFTPYSALAGGALIGLSVSLLLLLNGRIAGVSGILNGTVYSATQSERFWRLAFIVGLVIGAFLFRVLSPDFVSHRINYPLPLLILSGFLVGFGARLANGCISGHGVCGLANLSPRSVVATSIFMVTGMVTVYLLRHVLGVS
jgi:uncharacterized membrane protein YedE/YeeE